MITRTIIDKIRYWINKEKIIILKGPRQVGKTTILQYLKDLIEKEDKRVIYFSVDQEWNAEYFSNPNYFIKYLQVKFNFKEGDNVYIFLDEFQYIKDAGKFLKVIFDKYKKNIQLIVTGSSSLEITKNSEFLTGRKIEFIVTPISFPEFFSYKFNIKNQQLPLDINELKQNYAILKQDLDFYLSQYIKYGGYPEIVTTNSEKDKVSIIKELVSTYIQKDIAGFLNIENIDGFNKLIRCLSSQIGSLVNTNEITNTIGLSTDTTKKYLTILNHTFIYYYVPPFFTNIRKELTKMKKVYINDFGLLNFLNNNLVFSSMDLNAGSIIENFIYLSLMQQFDLDQIKFYRTVSKSEIDFILLYRKGLLPIEVKFRNKADKVPIAMKNFEENYKGKIYKKMIITKDYLHEEDQVFYIPAVLFPFIDLNKEL